MLVPQKCLGFKCNIFKISMFCKKCSNKAIEVFFHAVIPDVLKILAINWHPQSNFPPVQQCSKLGFCSKYISGFN